MQKDVEVDDEQRRMSTEADQQHKEALPKKKPSSTYQEAVADQRRMSQGAGSSQDHLKPQKIEGIEEARQALVKSGMARILQQLDEELEDAESRMTAAHHAGWY